MNALTADLERFLSLVPLVASAPEGVRVEELCERLSTTAAELHRLIERVTMVGTPDGSPDEMVEIYLEGDRVHVALPQGFIRPPRFSVAEMLSLLLVLAPLREGPFPELAERARSLGAKLTTSAAERAAELAPLLGERLSITSEESRANPDLRTLEAAVRDSRVVEVEYYSAGRDVLSRRELRPIALMQRGAAWYVLVDEGKSFKVSRMRCVSPTEKSFTRTAPPEPSMMSGRPFFEGAPREVEVRIGESVGSYPASATHQLRSWVRGKKGDGEILAPPGAREAMIEETRALLERYRGSP